MKEVDEKARGTVPCFLALNILLKNFACCIIMIVFEISHTSAH